VLLDAGAAVGEPADVRSGIDIDTWSRWGGYVRLQSDCHLFAQSITKVHKVPGAIPDLIHNTLSLENGKKDGGNKKSIWDSCHEWPMHHQDRAVLVVELPLALEDNALISRDASGSSGVNTQLHYLLRTDHIGIKVDFLNGRILSSDPDDVSVGINISFNHQLPRLFVDGAKITSTDSFVRVPIRPLSSGLLNQIDVLALLVLKRSLASAWGICSWVCK